MSWRLPKEVIRGSDQLENKGMKVLKTAIKRQENGRIYNVKTPAILAISGGQVTTKKE